MYEYQARVVRIVDGDTVDLDVDLGLEVHHLLRVRLYGLNAAEHGTPEGDRATAYLTGLLADEQVIVRTEKDRREKYGRYLATILLPREFAQDLDVNAHLVREGFAVPYFGGKR